MNMTKKLTFIITALLAGIAFMASCSKESEVDEGGKTKKVSASVRTNDIVPAGEATLNAVRNGQYVTLTWHADVTGAKIKQLAIMRNATGVSGQNRQTKVAELTPNATNHTDCLPDESAYWYWLKLITTDGRFQEIGPVRVGHDKAGSAHYINLEKKYNLSITRTDEIATLRWNFPDDEYKIISIIRFPFLVTEFTGTGRGVSVLETVEDKSRYIDALPDVNSDYWYWFRITMKSGTIIYRGPIKAQYVNQ